MNRSANVLGVDIVRRGLPSRVRAVEPGGRPIPRHDDDLIGSALHDALSAVNRRPALYDVAAVVNHMVQSAVQLVPGAAAGGVSISTGGVGGAHGSTSGAAGDLDALQHAHDEGPCLNALGGARFERTVVVAQDLAGDDAGRWPRFSPAAVELGYPAVMALQLPAVEGVGAALNLYGSTVDVFEPADWVLADVFVGRLAHLLFGDGANRSARPRQRTKRHDERELVRRLGRPPRSVNDQDRATRRADHEVERSPRSSLTHTVLPADSES